MEETLQQMVNTVRAACFRAFNAHASFLVGSIYSSYKAAPISSAEHREPCPRSAKELGTCACYNASHTS